jgi:hypothetical protein
LIVCCVLHDDYLLSVIHCAYDLQAIQCCGEYQRRVNAIAEMMKPAVQTPQSSKANSPSRSRSQRPPQPPPNAASAALAATGGLSFPRAHTLIPGAAAGAGADGADMSLSMGGSGLSSLRCFSEDYATSSSRQGGAPSIAASFNTQSLSSLDSYSRSISVVNDTMFATSCFIPDMSAESNAVVENLLTVDVHHGDSLESVARVGAARHQWNSNSQDVGSPQTRGVSTPPRHPASGSAAASVSASVFGSPGQQHQRQQPSTPTRALSVPRAVESARASEDVIYRPSPWKINPFGQDVDGARHSMGTAAAAGAVLGGVGGKTTCRIGTPICAPPVDLLEEYKVYVNCPFRMCCCDHAC